MIDRTSLITGDDTERLCNAIALTMQIPAEQISYLDGAVIAIARAGGGAGADTLAALLMYVAKQGDSSITLIDFAAEGDEGPAWDRSKQEYWCARTTISTDLGVELADVISENSLGIVIINMPANTLPELLKAELDFVPIIRALERPYVLIWIDRPTDESLDRIGGYRRAGGQAHCVVAAVESETLRADLEVLSVRLPPDIVCPVTIPRLPSRIAQSFYKQRTLLREAVSTASAGSQAAFYRKLKAFVAELKDAL